jgi:hypothetical protein
VTAVPDDESQVVPVAQPPDLAFFAILSSSAM